MGIPVQKFVETKGEVNVSDCVGCGRCVTSCPKGVLKVSGVRSLFKKTGETNSQVNDMEPEDIKAPIAASMGRRTDASDLVLNPHKGSNTHAVAKSGTPGVKSTKRNSREGKRSSKSTPYARTYAAFQEDLA
jgi:ferredoxin